MGGRLLVTALNRYQGKIRSEPTHSSELHLLTAYWTTLSLRAYSVKWCFDAGEYWIVETVERNAHDLVSGVTPTFGWMNLTKTPKFHNQNCPFLGRHLNSGIPKQEATILRTSLRNLLCLYCTESLSLPSNQTQSREGCRWKKMPWTNLVQEIWVWTCIV